MTQPEPDAQQRLLRSYTVLRLVRPDWGGALLVSCGLNPGGASLALAANLAGAVCLSIEEDSTVLKAALRSGSCDFIVNTLDEAIRTMKNEIRKHQPLSVGLLGNPIVVVDEILERGLKPELFTDFSSSLQAPSTSLARFRQFDRLRALGTMIVDFNSLPSGTLEPEGTNHHRLAAEDLLATFLEQRNWQLHSFPIKDSASLKNFEVYAASLVAEDDTVRLPWLHSAHRLLPRERPLRRALWVTPAEQELLERSFPPIQA